MYCIILHTVDFFLLEDITGMTWYQYFVYILNVLKSILSFRLFLNFRNNLPEILYIQIKTYLTTIRFRYLCKCFFHGVEKVYDSVCLNICLNKFIVTIVKFEITNQGIGNSAHNYINAHIYLLNIAGHIHNIVWQLYNNIYI